MGGNKKSTAQSIIIYKEISICSLAASFRSQSQKYRAIVNRMSLGNFPPIRLEFIF